MSWAENLGLGEPELAHLTRDVERDMKRGAFEDASSLLDLLLLLDPHRDQTWETRLELETLRGNADMVEALKEVRSWLR